MAKQYTMIACRPGSHAGCEGENEYVVTYTMTPGRPASGPTYACGGTPEEYPEVELINVNRDGMVGVQTDDHEDDWLINYIMENHEIDDGSDEADYRYEQERDRRMMENWK